MPEREREKYQSNKNKLSREKRNVTNYMLYREEIDYKVI